MNTLTPFFELGNYLYEGRKAKGLSQRDLALRTGYSQSYIDKIEKGRQRGSFKALVKIAEALDLSPGSVLQRAALANIGFIDIKDLTLDLEAHEFAELNPGIKRLLLELAPILKKYIQSY